MPVYDYLALNEKGRKFRGSITAANEVDLEERLSIIGLDLIDGKEKKKAKSVSVGKISLKELIILCVHIEQLERAGVPILEAVADIRDTAESQSIKTMMAEVYESIHGGDMLSDALAKHPKVFNNIFVSLVKAGEKTGNLHEVFFHLSKHLKWVDYIQRKIKKAIYYPIFLLFLMVGIIVLMMLFVIPKLSTFLTSQNFELPFYTKALISTSDFFVNYWYLLFIVPLVLFIVVKVAIRMSEDVAYNADLLKLNFPFIGPVIRKIELARFCHFFSIMYKSGIGILECLEIATNIVNNKVVRESANLIQTSVSEGNSLTDSLRMSNQFPNLVIRMFKIGEESGNLDSTLENINFFYDREVNDSVNNMVGVIQPTLTIIMGAIMMWVSVAVFGPLYNSFSQMNF